MDLERGVEKGAISLLFENAGGERLAQRLALDPNERDRAHRVEALGDGDGDATGAQRGDEVE
jgi:hypothetical protein